MENSVEPKAFQLPLELQFSMRKAEMRATEMTWDQLYLALLSLYHQRLMEWHALKSLMAEENVDIDFDIPSAVAEWIKGLIGRCFSHKSILSD